MRGSRSQRPPRSRPSGFHRGFGSAESRQRSTHHESIFFCSHRTAPGHRAGGMFCLFCRHALARSCRRHPACQGGRRPDGRSGRRMLLGRGGRVRARQGRHPGGVGLRRRPGGHSHVWAGEHRPHRPCRIGAHFLRPCAHQLRTAAEGVFFRRARSDRTEPAGAGHRHAIPVGDLLCQRGPEAGGRRLHRPTAGGRCVSRPHRHPGRAPEGLLRCRGLPPALSGPASGPALHRHQRPAEDRQSATAVSVPVCRHNKPAGTDQ